MRSSLSMHPAMRLTELCRTILAATDPEFKRLAPSGARLRAKPLRAFANGHAAILVLTTAEIPLVERQLRILCAVVQVYEGESSRIVLSRARRVVERLTRSLCDVCRQAAS